MKKLFIILGILLGLALGGGVYSYAYVPQSCSSVSGASVNGTYATSNNRHYYLVTLSNYSGSRCSASFKVLAKESGGSWETIYEGILTANNGGNSSQWVDMEGYESARLSDVSTWKCN